MNAHNNIIIKTAEEIRILHEAGKILAAVLKELKSSLTSGMTTKDVDVLAEKLMRGYKVVPAFKNYRGFPASVCVSINQEVVHGIPGDRVLKNGDIVSLDCGIIYKGFYSDSAFTKGIGSVGEELQRLMDVTNQSLYAGIMQAQVNNHLSDISHAVQRVVEANGFSVVRDFVGHGIGRHLHEDPEIPNFGEPKKGPVLKDGMVFCIEPMVNLGKWQAKILDDGWTVVTEDGKPSAHFEHAIAITKNGPIILTEQEHIK